MSHHGYIALILGAVFVLVLNVGLMYLIRRSRDDGYDDGAYTIGGEDSADGTTDGKR